MNIISYESDVAAWANQQAALIRSGQFNLLDLEHLAEEIEEVSKSEQRELAHRMAVLLMHLLKWEYQPLRRGNSWLRTIRDQRDDIKEHLDDVPSLRPKISDEKWIRSAYRSAVAKAAKETSIDADKFPETCPWSMVDVLTDGWLPIGTASTSAGEKVH